MRGTAKTLIKTLAISCVGIIVLAGCSRGELSKYQYITAGKVEYNGETTEINKCIDENTVLISRKGKIVEKVTNKEYKITNNGYLELAETDESTDITQNEQVINQVYSSTILNSTKYVNYLKESGYSIEFKANTEEFIEIYMKKDTENTYKRLIITEDNIAVATLKTILYSDIKDYII